MRTIRENLSNMEIENGRNEKSKRIYKKREEVKDNGER